VAIVTISVKNELFCLHGREGDAIIGYWSWVASCPRFTRYFILEGIGILKLMVRT